MYYPYYYYNFQSLIYIIPVLILAMWAQARVSSTYNKYAAVTNSRGYTGAQAARTILDQNGLQHISVEQVQGHLTDHYDPRSNVIRLSKDVYNSPSISAVGIAAHECGHAIQNAVKYGPMQLRSAIIPITNLGSKMAIPLLLFGFLFNMSSLIWVGIIGYSLMALFQLITLPVEYNASSRALATIQQNYLLDDRELLGAKKVLSAAALTYVAALASSLAQILRLLTIFGGRRNQN